MTKVATVLDPEGTWGATPEDERVEIMKDLTRWGLSVQDVGHWSRLRQVPPETEIDLLAIDYGALWQNGSYMDDESHDLLRFVEDHPGTLVVLWSSMTADGVINVMADFDDTVGWWKDAEWPPNLIPLHAWVNYRKPRPASSIDWLEKSIERIRAWCGAGPEIVPDLGELVPPEG